MSNDFGARNTDPQTSHEAAASVDKNHYNRLVVTTMKRKPNYDWSQQEVVDACGERYSTVTARFKPLERIGDIYVSGTKVSPTTGRKVQTYRLVTA